jgi:hypothetical protein
VAGDDVYEVCNYLDAIKYAREQIKVSVRPCRLVFLSTVLLARGDSSML